MGQIFIKVTSSTLAFPRKPWPPHCPNPVAHSGHPSPYLAPEGRARHVRGNVPMSHKLQSGPLTLIL